MYRVTYFINNNIISTFNKDDLFNKYIHEDDLIIINSCLNLKFIIYKIKLLISDIMKISIYDFNVTIINVKRINNI